MLSLADRLWIYFVKGRLPFYGMQFLANPLSICTWFLKFLVHKIDFLIWFFIYFKLDFYCLCSLQKSSLNRQKVKFKNQFRELEITKIKCRYIGGKSPKFYIRICFLHHFKLPLLLKIHHEPVSQKGNSIRLFMNWKFFITF